MRSPPAQLNVQPVPIGGSRDHLGESPVWDVARGSLSWVSIHERLVRRWTLAQEQHPETVELSRRVGAIGLCGPDGYVVALEDGIGLLDADLATSGDLTPVEADRPTTRLNDGRVAPDGAFVVGGMHEGEPQEPLAALHRWHADGRVEMLLDGISCANAIAFSPDGAKMYFADMPTRRIDVFDYGPDGVRDRRPFFALGDRPGLPDGSAVDEEGFVWNAVWGGSVVLRIDPDGVVERELRLPVTNPTCVAFGGDDLDILFVTTARFGLSEAALAREPLAGCLLACRPGVRGRPEHRIPAGRAA